MGLVIDRRKMLKIQMRIDLRGADIAVSQQFLYGPQILAGLQQMAGKGMPQHMRMNMLRDTLLPAPALQPQLDGAVAQAPTAAAADKQRRLPILTEPGLSLIHI